MKHIVSETVTQLLSYYSGEPVRRGS